MVAGFPGKPAKRRTSHRAYHSVAVSRPLRASGRPTPKPDAHSWRAEVEVPRWLEDLIQRIIQAIVDWINRCIPRYDPAAWNDNNGIQAHNNCYNYACDIRTDTFAQPGSASGHPYTNTSCQDVGAGAVSDGLISTDCDVGCGCTDCCHKVALVISPGPQFIDFHWYRQGPDGMWSHKPGDGTARNIDESKYLISDPRTADRGPYTIFCGCYCVCKSKVHIS
jgi:hypothetical protein